MLQRAALLALAWSLGGCALFPVSEAECKPASWRDRGYTDGFGGAFAQDLRLVPGSRERYGLTVETQAYFEGYREGYAEWSRMRMTYD
ncbi:MAG TPA: hypothetical protein VNC62_13815 [Burkholderiales bacterium]|nr:hypothetical protein [Burkholderiales bacterium]